MNRKYQIFVSSTFEDLKAERFAVSNAILESGDIPVGMETFRATDESQWALIQRQIAETDYYVVIIGHRYGSTLNGVSYTEMEFDYAVRKHIPTLAFLVDPHAAAGEAWVDENNQYLNAFKRKIQKDRLVAFWDNADDLKAKFVVALTEQKILYPRRGWAPGRPVAPPTSNAGWWLSSAIAILLALLVVFYLGPRAPKDSAANVHSTANKLEKIYWDPPPPRNLRVGIVAYDNIKTRAQTMKSYFSKLGYKLTFASGTAEQVLDWITDGTVDVAILSPGAFAETDAWLTDDEKSQKEHEHSLPRWRCNYLVTPSLPASTNPFASTVRRSGGGTLYHPQCLISKQNLIDIRLELEAKHSPVNNPENPVEIVEAASKLGLIQFVFSDPLSLSGTIYPRAMLKESVGSDRLASNGELSFGFADTLTLLLSPKERKIDLNDGEKRYRVGFVFDGAVIDGHEDEMGQKLIEVKYTSNIEPKQTKYFLKDDELPVEVWVVRPDFDDADGIVDRDATIDSATRATKILRDKLLQQGPFFTDQAPTSPPRTSDIHALGLKVKRWVEAATDRPAARGSSISDILDSMRHYQRSHDQSPPRLALVLSGGGAKCAYQAGAIAHIEQELVHLQQLKRLAAVGAERGSFPDINLVVGSSGGALNALPTALGVTKGGVSKKDDLSAFPLAQLWHSVNLADLLEPADGARELLGVSLGLVLLLVTWLVGEIFVRIASVFSRKASSRGWRTVFINAPFILQCFLSLITLYFWCLFCFNPRYVDHLARPNHYYFYLFWLPLNVSFGWVGVTLLAGTTVSAVRGILRPHWRNIPFNVKLWHGLALLTVCVAIFGVLALRERKGFSTNEKLKNTIVDSMQDLLAPALTDGVKQGGGVDERATSWSKHIWEHKRPRDLIIAVTVLGKDGPADRYLKVPGLRDAGGSGETDQGVMSIRRGSELHVFENRSRLMNLMIASCTIFPVFQSEPFHDSAGHKETMKIVDGGFAHNIPVEAAVDSGATHIIVIEATPQFDRGEKDKFWQNLMTAYDLLFAQAQLTDLRSRQKVEIYTLRPRNASLKTLDFSPVFTKQAVDEGFDEAQAGDFIQYSGPPQFEDKLN
jgi:predicted acylesterase/phospholipase RssA/ABC-type phosphate/phosphonate transport system substrate-binding protein